MFKLIFLLILFSNSMIQNSESRIQLIVWNVGQGQWVTIIYPTQCLHFDVGGETAPFRKVIKSCKEKSNKIFLSHGDWDHLNKLNFFNKGKMDTCLVNKPRDKKISLSKLKLLSKIKMCTSKSSTDVSIINPQVTCSAADNNCHSYIFQWKNKILFPGDINKKTEKMWIKKINKNVEILILSHHGSKFSNSQELLNGMSLTQGIVSARYKKYGHPAVEVTKRFKKSKIPLLRTEEWGNLIIEL